MASRSRDTAPSPLPTPAAPAASSTRDIVFHPSDHFRLLVESVQDYAIFLLDPNGWVTSWNPGAQHIKGYAAAEIVGKHFSVFYPPDALARGWPQQELEIATALGRFEEEGWRVRKDGSIFWASVVITALRDPSGRLCGFAKITRDLSERKRQEESLRRSEERFRLLIDGVKDYAIIFLTEEGRVASWNAGAERILGYAADEVVGRHCSTFFRSADANEDAAGRELEASMRAGHVESEGWRVRKNGARFWAHVVTTPLRDKAGRLVGYAQVTRDLTENKRMEALEEAGRRMQEFIAMLGHELRNPLAPIRNALEVVRSQPADAQTLQHQLDIIDRQSLQLARLVDNLLDVTQVTGGRIDIERAPVDVREVVMAAAEAAKPAFDARRHMLEIHAESGVPWVTGDASRLRQVISNLLDNAAKYTPEGGRIRVSVETGEQEVAVRVHDNGIGMPTELQRQVFDLFVQGERELDRAEGGIGVGLSVARRIVHLHHGTIEGFSEGKGRGSEFVVRLPVSVKQKRAQPADLPRGVGVDGGALRILVVDDNHDSAESLSTLLTLWGHDVRIAYDARRGLELAAEHRPELILLDIGLPGMDGYEAARRLRAMPVVGRSTIAALTGYAQPEDRRRAEEAGFDAHLAKPPPVDALLRLVEQDAER